MQIHHTHTRHILSDHPGLGALMGALFAQSGVPVFHQTQPALNPRKPYGREGALDTAPTAITIPLPYRPTGSAHAHLANMARWQAAGSQQEHGLPSVSWISPES